MKFRETAYQALPAVLQDLSLAYASRKIANRRYSARFHQRLQKILLRDRLPGNELQTCLIKALKHNLVVAYEKTPFYQRFFDEAGFNPHRFHDPEELLSFPFLNKEIIRSNYQDIINTQYKGKQFLIKTSGTTGSGFIFPETVKAEHYQWATWWRYRQNIGIKLNTRCAIFGGRTIIPVRQTKPPYWKMLSGLNQVSFSMYHLNSSTVKRYVDELNKQKIGWIHGYPSTLSCLASLMKEQTLFLNYPVQFITTGAENLLDHQRVIISEVFGVDPYQHYGLSEPVANISECEYRSLHIDEDYSFVELIPVPHTTGKYRVVGTSLTNEVLFFLRYDTNDIVTLADNQSCPCGRNGRIISSIDGRQEDFITLKNGTQIGRLDHILKDMVNVKEAQIRQEKTGRIIFNIVRNHLFNGDDERRLNREITSRLASVEFIIRYTDMIEKSETGKLRFVVTE